MSKKLMDRTKSYDWCNVGVGVNGNNTRIVCVRDSIGYVHDWETNVKCYGEPSTKDVTSEVNNYKNNKSDNDQSGENNKFSK